MEPKTPSDSKTALTDHILPSQTNPHGTIFGGEVISYIDRVANICSARHARAETVTASMSQFNFLSPIKMGDAIIANASVTWAGRTSMEIRVKVEGENLKTGEQHLTGICYLICVAMDEHEQPVAVPQLNPQTKEEKELFQQAIERAEKRRKDKEES